MGKEITLKEPAQITLKTLNVKSAFSLQSLQSFSCPFYAEDENFLSEICRIHSREILRCFIQVNAPGLIKTCKGVMNYLQENVDRIDSFDRAWSSCFGAVHHQLTNTGIDATLPAAMTALHFSSLGFTGQWSANLPVTYRFLWQNSLLPRCNSIHCDANERQARIHLRNGSNKPIDIFYSFITKNWISPCCESIDRLPAVYTGEAEKTITISSSAGETPGFFMFQADAIDPQKASAFTEQCSGAFDLIASCAAPYNGWIKRVLTHLVPLDTKEGFLSSSSSAFLPGLLQIAFDKSAAATAEMLIHESAHQYLNLALRIGYMVDGSDKKLYFSPAKGMERPIEKIFVAYHAFANVDIFYKACLAHGVTGNGYITDSAEQLEPQLRLMEHHLNETNSLTAMGGIILQSLLNKINKN